MFSVSGQQWQKRKKIFFCPEITQMGFNIPCGYLLCMGMRDKLLNGSEPWFLCGGGEVRAGYE